MNAFAMLPLPIVGAWTNIGSVGAAVPLNVANDYMGVVFTPTPGASGMYLHLDLGASPRPVDQIMLFGVTGATAAMDIFADAADDPDMTVNAVAVGGGDFLAGSEMPVHGRGVGYMEFAAPVTRRYWRLGIYSMPAEGISIARVAMGHRLTLERNFAFGGGFGLRDLGGLDFGAYGNLIRRHGAGLRTIGLTFPAVSPEEVAAKVGPLIEIARGTRPIVLVTDPTPHAMRQRRCWFGPLTGDLGTVWRNAAAYEWRASLIDLVPVPADLAVPA